MSIIRYIIGFVFAAAALAFGTAFSVRAEQLVFSLSEKAAVTDGRAEIPVAVTENPGVQSWVMILEYSGGAVFEDCRTELFPGLTFADDPAKGRLVLNYFGSGDISATGTAFTAVFSGADSASFRLLASPDPDDFYDFADNTIPCAVLRETLTITQEVASPEKSPAVTAVSAVSAPAESVSAGTDSPAVTAALPADPPAVTSSAAQTAGAEQEEAAVTEAQKAPAAEAETVPVTTAPATETATEPVTESPAEAAPSPEEVPDSASLAPSETGAGGSIAPALAALSGAVIVVAAGRFSRRGHRD